MQRISLPAEHVVCAVPSARVIRSPSRPRSTRIRTPSPQRHDSIRVGILTITPCRHNRDHHSHRVSTCSQQRQGQVLMSLVLLEHVGLGVEYGEIRSRGGCGNSVHTSGTLFTPVFTPRNRSHGTHTEHQGVVHFHFGTSILTALICVHPVHTCVHTCTSFHF